MKTSFALSIVLLLLALSGNLSPASAQPNGAPIVIAVQTPLTGLWQDFGTPSVEAVTNMVTLYNEKGGLLGRPIKLLEVDDGCKKENSEKAINAITKAGAKFVIGPICDEVFDEMAPLYTKHRILNISPQVQVENQREYGENPWAFSMFPEPVDRVRTILSFLKSKRVRKVALTTDSASESSEEASRFLDEAPTYNVEVVSDVEFSDLPDVFDFTLHTNDTLNIIDYIVYLGDEELGEPLARVMTKKSQTPIIGDERLKYVASKHPGKVQFLDGFPFPEDFYNKLMAYVQSTGKQVGPAFVESLSSADGLFKAIIRANSLDPDKVAKQLESGEIVTELRQLTFTDNGNFTEGNTYKVYQFQLGQQIFAK